MPRRILLMASLLAMLVPAAVRADAPPVWLLSWGSQGSADGQFQFPNDVCLDGAGFVYVADYHHHVVKKFDANGNYLMKFGFGALNGPWSVAVDANGLLYVPDGANGYIQEFNSGGGFLSQWHLPPATDTTSDAQVALDVSAAGDVYVTDMMNNIHQYTSAGVRVRGWPIGAVRRTVSNYLPEIAVAPNGDVYAYDRDSRAIRHFDASGNFLAEVHASGVSDGWIGGETGFTVDLFGNLWTSAGNEVRKFDAGGSLLTRWGTVGTGPGQFNGVNGVAVTPDGVVFVVDKNNHRIQKFGPAVVPTVKTSWGRVKALYH